MNKHDKSKKNKKPFSCTEGDNKNKALRVGSFNICKGMNNKEELLLNMMENEDFDIIAVHETDIQEFDEKRPFTLLGFRTYWPLQRS